MAYSDKELKDATQVAYLNCINKGMKNLIADGKEGPFNLRKLIEQSVDFTQIRQLAEADGKDFDHMTLQEKVQYSDISKRDKQILAVLPPESLKWEIVDIHDTRDENGFYGCIIQTSDDKAIVAFRGSEGFDNYNGLIHDWVQADFGLYNTVETNQQKETREYLKRISDLKLLDKYESVAVTGHSLGGNLASHFAVSNYYPNLDEPILDNIDQVVSFDGPGVSDEYLKNYASEIEKASPNITHYKWSPIGSLLYTLPGSKEEFLKIDEEQGKESLLKRIKYKTFYRHDTRSLLFDEQGNAERGKQDFLSKQFEQTSRLAEGFPGEITQAMNYISTSVFGKFLYEKENGQIGFKLPFVNKEKKKTSFEFRVGDLLKTFVNTYKRGTERLGSYMDRADDALTELSKSMFPDVQIVGTGGYTLRNTDGFER